MGHATVIVNALLEDLTSRLPYLRREFPDVTDREIEQLQKLNPDGRYSAWLLRQWRNGTLENDAAKVLQQFDKVKHQLPTRDINRYRSYADLKHAVYGIQRRDSLQKIGQAGNVIAYRISDPDAARRFFAKTAWCVKNPEDFKKYAPEGFVYFEESGKPFILAHSLGFQLRDIHNRQINLDALPSLLKRLIVRLCPWLDPKIDEKLSKISPAEAAALAQARQNYPGITAQGFEKLQDAFVVIRKRFIGERTGMFQAHPDRRFGLTTTDEALRLWVTRKRSATGALKPSPMERNLRFLLTDEVTQHRLGIR